MMQISAELIKARRHRMLRALLVVMVLVELLIIGGMRTWQPMPRILMPTPTMTLPRFAHPRLFRESFFLH